MKHSIIGLRDTDRNSHNFHIYNSDYHATVLCDGMISSSYLVDSDSKLCIQTLTKSNNTYTCRTRIGNEIYFDKYTLFPHVNFYASSDDYKRLTGLSSADDFVNSLILKSRNRNIPFFLELSEIVNAHCLELKKPKIANWSTENILLENPIGVRAFVQFATSSFANRQAN